jgi:hypothetical protein
VMKEYNYHQEQKHEYLAESAPPGPPPALPRPPTSSTYSQQHRYLSAELGSPKPLVESPITFTDPARGINMVS